MTEHVFDDDLERPTGARQLLEGWICLRHGARDYVPRSLRLHHWSTLGFASLRSASPSSPRATLAL